NGCCVFKVKKDHDARFRCFNQRIKSLSTGCTNRQIESKTRLTDARQCLKYSDLAAMQASYHFFWRRKGHQHKPTYWLSKIVNRFDRVIDRRGFVVRFVTHRRPCDSPDFA